MGLPTPCHSASWIEGDRHHGQGVDNPAGCVPRADAGSTNNPSTIQPRGASFRCRHRVGFRYRLTDPGGGAPRFGPRRGSTSIRTLRRWSRPTWERGGGRGAGRHGLSCETVRRTCTRRCSRTTWCASRDCCPRPADAARRRLRPSRRPSGIGPARNPADGASGSFPATPTAPVGDVRDRFPPIFACFATSRPIREIVAGRAETRPRIARPHSRTRTI